MAVIQISQIQVRRGLLEELGQLGAGEFGWAIDKLRLFIGNGTIQEGAPYEGNTEILTGNSDLLTLLNVYTYRGILGGYEVQTGPDLLNKVIRSFQDKVDDIVNVKDFGAKGDGFNDDTEAIQRAINEIYARQALFAPVITRRSITFHPGVYVISSALLLPPFACLRNSGRESVVIRLVGNSSDSVFITTDGGGSYDGSNSLGIITSTSKVGPVEISGITFETERTDAVVGTIDSTNGAYFIRCQFKGGNPVPESIGTSRSVSVTSRVINTKNIHFIECDFTRSDIGLEVINTVDVSDVVVDRCVFSDLYQGINVDSLLPNASVLVGMRITNSVFNTIAQQAIKTSANIDGVTSAFNTFVNVGNTYNLETPPITPVIEFGGNLSYSFADIITRTESDDSLVESVVHHSPITVSTNAATNFKFGNTYQTIGKSVLVSNATNNLIPLNRRYKSGIIDYSVERNAVFRSGSIKFSLNSATQNFEFHDSYIETDYTGVDLSVEYNSYTGELKPYIICIADNLGFPAVVTYDIKSLYQ